MKRMRLLLANLPLKRKIMLILLAVNVLLFGVIATVGLRVITEENNKLLYRATAASLSYSATSVSSALTEVERLSELLLTDATVQEQLVVMQESADDIIARSTAYRLLNQTLQAYRQQFLSSNIYYISLYGESLSLHTDTARAQKLPAAEREKILNAGLVADGKPAWVQDYCPEQGLFLARAVRRIKPMELDTLGVLNICVRFDGLVEDRTDISAQYETAYYLVLDGETPLYASPGLPDEVFRAAQGVEPSGYRVLDLDGKSYFAVRGEIPGYDWQYLSLVSYDSTRRAVFMSNVLFFAVMLGGLFVTSLLCSVLVNRVTAHFGTLINKMQTFGENETALVTTPYDYTERRDEIGQLHRQFDSMAQQIIHYIETDYANRLMMKDAQIKALEAQIDPHFLYNVLASISWRAQAIGEQKIDSMVQALGKLLRTTLSADEESFTLAKELLLVQSYMTIQQLRFEDELRFETQVPQGLLDAEIPKLSLQPLVENAIRYGLEENADGCLVRVQARQIEDELVIEVANSGSRFPPDLLRRLESNELHAHGFGIGIVNIHKRLRLMFGEAYGLVFCNEDNMAVVQMHIPYRPVL